MTSKVAPSLEKHPHGQNAWTVHLHPGAMMSVTDSDINYGDCLPAGVTLELKCHDDGQCLSVEIVGKFPADSVTMRGVSSRIGTLKSGDLLTLGRYAWILHVYAAGHGIGLEPTDPLPGLDLELCEVTVGQRLEIPALRIEAGQTVAIVGKSGAGKSTFIRELVEPRRGRGRVSIGGIPRTDLFDPAPLMVAYVPQVDLVHSDLTLIQQTRSLVELAGVEEAGEQGENALRAVGLREMHHRFPDQVSGGQLRRARLAAALGRRPGVLLLDEPDSGLDPDTASDIRRLLKTFSLLGCTVVMITHHRHGLSDFDRILELEKGRIVEDSSPRALAEITPDDAISQETTKDPTEESMFLRRMVGQFKGLLRRDFEKQVNREFASWTVRGKRSAVRIPQWCLNLLGIPILFGFAVAVTSPVTSASYDQPSYLISFLCVLSVIWMAASNSYLALTTEWDRIQFERSQGLPPYVYLLSKSVTLGLAALLQVGLFWIALSATRTYGIGQPIFFGTLVGEPSDISTMIGGQSFEHVDEHRFAAVMVLVLTGLAASQMGLVISALARQRIQIAAAILPLVMIVQILFSAFVLRADQSIDTLEICYRGFWATRDCQGAVNCPAHSVTHLVRAGFICQDCEDSLYDLRGDVYEATDEEKVTKFTAAVKQLRGTTLDEEETSYRVENASIVPNYFGVVMSYFTLTRYADLALRPLVGPPQEQSHRQAYGYDSTALHGAIRLAQIALLFHLVTAVLIGTVRPKRIFHRWRRQRLAKAAVAATALLVSGFWITGAAHGDTPGAQQVIELRIEDGRYDAAPILGAQAVETELQAEVWYPFTNRTRFALAVLEARGTIENLSIRDDAIRFSFTPRTSDTLLAKLCPPQLLDVESIGEAKQLVILVHGLEGGPITYRDLAPGFEERGWYPLRLIYPNDGEIELAASYLAEQIGELSDRYPESRMVIVAHSLGGLVSWSALTRLDRPTKVTDLFTLGTPFGGSTLAELQGELELADVAVRLVERDWTSLDITSDGDGEASGLLRPGNARLQKLVQTPLPDGIRLHLIAGRGGPIPADRQSQIRDSLERWIQRLQPDSELADKLRILVNSDECVRGLGDGAVTITSATVPKAVASNVHVVDLSHTGFLAASDDQSQLLDWIVSRMRERDD